MSAAETPLLCLIASHFISFLNKHITLIGTQVRINTANSAIADITLLDFLLLYLTTNIDVIIPVIYVNTKNNTPLENSVENISYN